MISMNLNQQRTEATSASAPVGSPKTNRVEPGKTILAHERHRLDPVDVATIQRTIEDGLCILTFDRPDSSANIFDRATLLELDDHLDYFKDHPELEGMVITSSKPSIFIAGADLKVFQRLAAGSGRDPHNEMTGLIQLGQSVFSRLARIKRPKVAAIHGACVGGGYELALACDYRLASPDKVTKIGLPETQLGILPAWGGSTFLPRLIGLPKALDIILGGKVVPAQKARKLGMVDELVPKENLQAKACELLRSGKVQRRANRRNALPRRIARKVQAKATHYLVHRSVMARTHGHYPAVTKALEVVTKGYAMTSGESLWLEREAVTELARTDACRNLVRLYFLQERVKARAKPSTVNHETPPPPVTEATVVGAGVMGSGIAQWFASRGVNVLLKDVDEKQLARGMANARKLFESGVKRHKLTAHDARTGMDRIHPAVGNVSLERMDIIVEAAVEKMELKKQIFRQLALHSGPETVLATNTSALSIDELATATGAPERVCGLHFFNPVHRMQLVEVVRGEKTSPEVVKRAVRFAVQMGKLPIVVKDSPGFVVNRILMPYLIEAGRLLEQGADPKRIDQAMLDFGMPMGPLRLLDEVGIDVAYHVAGTLREKLGDRVRIPNVFEKMLDAGSLGRKSGRGFYTYGKHSKVNASLADWQTGSSAASLIRDEIQTRLMLLMVNEAARCLEEGVATSADDIDFAMIMGTGFAPFRGGPLHHAQTVGARKLVALMDWLVEQGEPQFEPCDLLKAQLLDEPSDTTGKGAQA